MKIPKVSLIALLAAASLFSQSSVLRADDEKKDAKPAETKPEQAPDRPRQGQGFGVDGRLARLTEQLSLTDDQKPKVKAVLEAQMKDMTGVRDLPQDQRREKAMAMREEMNKKMKEILTEDQYKKYETTFRGGMRPGGPRSNAGGEGGEKKPDAQK